MDKQKELDNYSNSLIDEYDRHYALVVDDQDKEILDNLIKRVVEDTRRACKEAYIGNREYRRIGETAEAILEAVPKVEGKG